MGLGLFMSQVNWTQLNEAVVFIRVLAFSGSSRVPEVGHPPTLPHHPVGLCGSARESAILSHAASTGTARHPLLLVAVHPLGFSSGAEETQHEPWKVQAHPFG